MPLLLLALLASLESDSLRERSAAMESYARMGRSAVPALVALAEDESRNYRTRDCAVRVLGRIQDARSAAALTRMLREGPGPLRPTAAEGLAALGRLDPLLPLLSLSGSDTCSLRGSVAAVLGRSRDPRALPALRKAARGDDACVRAHAVSALADAAFLKDSDADIRIAAAAGLARAGDRRSVGDLLEALKDERDPVVQRALALSLRDFRDPRAAEPLLHLLGRESGSKVRRALERRPGTTRGIVDKDLGLYREDIAEAVAPIPHPSVEKALFDALQRRDLAVLRGAAPFYLERSLPSEEALLEAFSSAGERSECMAGLFLKSGRPALVQTAQSWLESWPLREQRVDGLPSCGGR